MLKYLDLNDSIAYVEQLIKDNNYPSISPIKLLENAIKQDSIKPFFRFTGYASTCDSSKTRFNDVIQIMGIKGYFTDPYFSDYADKTRCCTFLDLSQASFRVGLGEVYELLYIDVLKFAVPYSKETPAGGYDATIHDNILIEKGDIVSLYNMQPMINDNFEILTRENKPAYTEVIDIPRESVFFLAEDIKSLFITDSGHSQSDIDTPHRLFKYFDFDQTVQFFNNQLNGFFKESNLIDLIANKELLPVVYFEGFAESYSYNTNQSKYPEDFDEENKEWAVIPPQKNMVTGYFYPLDIMLLINGSSYSNRFTVHQILEQQAIPNKDLPNRGLNHKGGVFREIAIQQGDIIQLFRYDDGFECSISPKFDKVDLRFSIYDLGICAARFNVPSEVGIKESNANLSLDLQALLDQKNLEIKKLKEQLQKAQASLPDDDDDEDMNPKRLKTVKHLLNVLFYKAGYDAESHSGTVNAKIVELSKKMNTPLTKKPVTYWIKEIQQLRLEKEED